MDKQNAINLVSSIIKDNGLVYNDLKPYLVDIPVSYSANDFNTLKEICKMFYDNMVDNCGKTSAFNWASDKIDSYWRDIIGIRPARIFKTVNVNLGISLVVPNNYSECDIIDYAFQQNLYSSDVDAGRVSVDIEPFQEGLEEYELSHYDYVNNSDEFIDGDFED